MFPSEELECAVCYCEYSRRDRIPRMLHCKHTFCAHCLEKMSQSDGIIRSVCCPLCRWITCTRVNLTLSGALWVNTGIWDQISEEREREERAWTYGSMKGLSNTEKRPVDSEQPWENFTAILEKLFSCVLPQGRDVA